VAIDQQKQPTSLWVGVDVTFDLPASRLPWSLFNPHALCRVSEWIEARILLTTVDYRSLPDIDNSTKHGLTKVVYPLTDIHVFYTDYLVLYYYSYL